MGNCVAVLKTQDSASERTCSSYSREECILIERHIQENAVGIAVPRVSSFRELNGEEGRKFCPESPDRCVESDYEDFFSVNGDLTPSNTNSPIHQSSLTETPQLDKSLYGDSTLNSVLEPPETAVIKQLIELFHESFNGDESGDPSAGHESLHYRSDAEPSIFDLPQNGANKSPYQTIADIVFRSVRTPSTNSKPCGTRKATEFAQCCCLPKLARSLSCSERKRH